MSNLPARDRSRSCPACGVRHVAEAWQWLALVEVLAPCEIERNVLGWPLDLCIEVRRCACGRPLGAKRPYRHP